MLSHIAQVFSSQGVILPGTEYVPVPVRDKAKPSCDHKGDCSCFGKFDQQAAKLDLSPGARAQAKSGDGSVPVENAGEAAANAGETTGTPTEADGADQSHDDARLNEEERKQVEEMGKRDREVKQHEQQHVAAAGGFARGGPKFEYQAGPDGKSYAVGGHVDIDVSPVPGNPQATLQKASIVQRAALAPADPSGADRAVASAAAAMASGARKEIARERAEKIGETTAPTDAEPRSREVARAYAPGLNRPGRRVDAFA